ncbi:MAG TPA: protease complex subunit PrcB family protein [Myxococcales bacterium]
MRVLPAILVSLAACGGSSGGIAHLEATTNYAPPIPTDAQPKILRRIAAQPFGGGALSHSGIHDKRRQVITDSAAWQSVWNEIVAGISPRPALPAVDFTADMVLVAAQGDEPSGGFGIFIDGAAMTLDGTLIVAVTTAAPGPGCNNTQQITNPVDVAVAVKVTTVNFTERTGVFRCQ